MFFGQFADYIYHLFPAAIKKIGKSQNNVYALCRVIGGLFDDAKIKLQWVRDQLTLATCTPELLMQIHGIERDMPRFSGEEIEAYRGRLMIKSKIAEKAGTNEGIKAAMIALGYDGSYIEPYCRLDPARWSEFIVWLRSDSEQSQINDYAVIDAEVMAIKPAASLPNYGMEFASGIDIDTTVVSGVIIEPLCGTFFCGQYPPMGSDLS